MLASWATATWIASPIAVPPPGARVPSASFTDPLSLVSGAITWARELKMTRPTCALLGSLSISVRPAAIAASIRVGCTSVAAIDPETSTASMTLVCPFGIRMVASGPAIDSSRPATPAMKRIAGRCRRNPGPLPMTWLSKARFVKRTA
jgi:hypothetical protein